MTLRTVLAVGIALFTTVFALQNAAPVTVTLVIWRFDSSLALVLVFAVMAGAIAVALVAAPAAIRHKWELADRERRLSELRARIQDLERQLETRRHGRTEVNARGGNA